MSSAQLKDIIFSGVNRVTSKFLTGKGGSTELVSLTHGRNDCKSVAPGNQVKEIAITENGAVYQEGDNGKLFAVAVKVTLSNGNVSTIAKGYGNREAVQDDLFQKLRGLPKTQGMLEL